MMLIYLCSRQLREGRNLELNNSILRSAWKEIISGKTVMGFEEPVDTLKTRDPLFAACVCGRFQNGTGIRWHWHHIFGARAKK